MSHAVAKPGACVRLDIDEFLEWRPWLWRKAFLHAIGGIPGLQALSGKRVLEVGCRYGKMSCLFGLFGATVIGVDIDKNAVERAKEEVQKRHLEDCVQILHTNGDVRTIGEAPFDIVFTKSVLYYCKALDERLSQFYAVLRPGGRGIFVENFIGSELEKHLRYQLLHRRWMPTANDYVGIRKAQLPIFQKWFDDLQFKSFWRTCCTVTGRAKPSRL